MAWHAQLFTDQLKVTKNRDRQKRDGDQRNNTITQKMLLASICEKIFAYD